MDDSCLVGRAREGQLDPGLTVKKSLRTKRSLPKLLILSRSKSLKSRPRPSQVLSRGITSESLRDSKSSPNPTYLTKSTTCVSRPHTSGEDKPLKELDQNILRGKDKNHVGISDTELRRSKSKPVPNFSRHNYPIESPELTGSSISPFSQVPTRRQDFSGNELSRPYDLHVQQPYSAGFRGLRAPTTCGYEPSSANWAVYGPQTATNPTFSATFLNGSHYNTPLVASARQAKNESKRHRKYHVTDQWNRQKEEEAREEARGSVNSGVSTGSSHLDSNSTQRSSVFTKLSSVSGTTDGLDELDDCQDGMTVDETIDLYSAGFEDDCFPDKDWPIPGDEDGRAERPWQIAEALNDPISPDVLSSRRVIAEPPTSVAIISGDVFKSLFPHPPPVQQPSNTHDQYGFQKHSREIPLAQYDSWYNEYSKLQSRRTSKWIELMRDQGLPTKDPTRFPQPSAKVQRYIRKGLPPAWRGEAWFFYAGGNDYLWAHPGHYAELVLRSQTSALSPSDKESIERDLNRTFPDNIHFKPLTPQSPPAETPLLSALRRVLCAFALDHPRIGYCQSLNFIAGLLLLFLPEEKAFWMLHIITTSYLPGTHEMNLEGANIDLWVLMSALKDASPAVWAKIGGEIQTNTLRLPPISLCTTSWFMSLFIGTLPIESVLRVWDVLFYEGAKTVFRVALAVFRLGENEIKSVSDPMEIFQVVQSLPRKMLAVGGLIEVAHGRGALGKKWIERKRQERKDWYAAERKSEKRRKESRDAGRKASDARAAKDVVAPAAEAKEPTPAVDDGPARSRSNTSNTWWPRMGSKKTKSQ